jgi:hypothetical protein
MLLFKSLAACLGEIVSTIFRVIISSASSRPVHWLIGRPDVSGSSQASASSWQRWSAVIRGGPPGRGRSSNRSSALNSSNGIGSRANHLSRHCLAVNRVTPTLRAIAELSFSSAASRTIQARLAICCRVLCASTSSRNWRFASFDNVTGNGLGPGIFHPLFLALSRCLIPYHTPDISI